MCWLRLLSCCLKTGFKLFRSALFYQLAAILSIDSQIFENCVMKIPGFRQVKKKFKQQLINFTFHLGGSNNSVLYYLRLETKVIFLDICSIISFVSFSFLPQFCTKQNGNSHKLIPNFFQQSAGLSLVLWVLFPRENENNISICTWKLRTKCPHIFQKTRLEWNLYSVSFWILERIYKVSMTMIS